MTTLSLRKTHKQITYIFVFGQNDTKQQILCLGKHHQQQQTKQQRGQQRLQRKNREKAKETNVVQIAALFS